MKPFNFASTLFFVIGLSTRTASAEDCSSPELRSPRAIDVRSRVNRAATHWGARPANDRLEIKVVEVAKPETALVEYEVNYDEGDGHLAHHFEVLYRSVVKGTHVRIVPKAFGKEQLVASTCPDPSAPVVDDQAKAAAKADRVPAEKPKR